MQLIFTKGVLQTIFSLSIIFLISSCINVSTEWNINVEQQKIEGSNIRIYKFDAWGGRDSHVSGIKLIDSLKGFKNSDVTSGNVFQYLVNIPNKDTIVVAKTILQNNPEGESIRSISVSFQKVGKIILKTITYPYDGSITGICTLKSYNFKEFIETRDSIIFFRNESVFTNGRDFDRISIPKGNVTIYKSRSREKVAKIVYEDLIIFDDLIESDGIQICHMTKYFTPISETHMSEFSDYGLYKSVEYEN